MGICCSSTKKTGKSKKQYVMNEPEQEKDDNIASV